MIEGMRGVPLLFLLSLSIQDPVEPAAPLAWKLGKNEFVRYNISKVKFEEGGEETVRGNPERLVGVFAYDIADKSLYRPATLDIAELPLLLGLSLPPKPLKAGQSHEWTQEFDENFDCGPVTAKVTATRGAAVDIELVSCAKIDFTARLSKSLRPPASPKPQRNIEKGRFEATLYFDPARGVARRL